MVKKILGTFFIFIAFFLFHSSAWASNSYVTIINPVRGQEFWDNSTQKPQDAVLGEVQILDKHQLPATWLLRFDALSDSEIIKALPAADEKGLLLEVTPSLSENAQVTYNRSGAWHLAQSVFLTGYSQEDRQKLIDSDFNQFKKTFGKFPKSVGAWWIDSFSLNYMQKKYGISGALIVSDQYSTDNYQIWGQYWSTHYYPAKLDALYPAQSVDEKIPVVITQWAARDPINGYSNGVHESTYSVQPNDYLDYHHLDTSYFAKLIDIYTTQKLNDFGQVVVGLENSYSWSKYRDEYNRQMSVIASKQASNQFQVVSQADFSSWYLQTFPQLSPSQIIVADDPLGTSAKAVWFMNPYYRAGWFYNQQGSVFRDIREYTKGEIEPCYNRPCQSLDFAKLPLHVLDDVTYQTHWLIDAGKISNINVRQDRDSFVLSYQTAANLSSVIKFLPRDISVKDQKYTISNAISSGIDSQRNPTVFNYINLSGDTSNLQTTPWQLLGGGGVFILFLLLSILGPGLFISCKLIKDGFLERVFLGFSIGAAGLTLVSFLAGIISQSLIVPVVILYSLVSLWFLKDSKKILPKFSNLPKLETLLILAGTFFQSYVVLKSGWLYDFGLGFWGPTGHDHIWHQALINQLMQHIPPQNPSFSNVTLSNYHYFFDLLVAATAMVTNLPVLDLLYRFYPLTLSIFLGLGSLVLARRLFKNRLAQIMALYLIYFAGSFGWIVEYIKQHSLGGESTFWSNQAISFNLNPPFAISLILLFALGLMLDLQVCSLFWDLSLVLIAGTLLEFKVYAGIVAFLALGLVALQQVFFQRSFRLLKVVVLAAIVSGLIFLPQNQGALGLLIFDPFWFVHTMIDYPDRVGWARLSLARMAYFERGQWLKYLTVELLGLVIFLVGNLGIRSLSLLVLQRFWHKKGWQDNLQLFIIGCCLASFVLPLLFIQKGNAWNTIQLFYYLLYLSALVAGGVVSRGFYRLPKAGGVLLITIIVLVAPVNSITSFKDYSGKTPPAALSKNEYLGLLYLKSQPPGAVLTYPYTKEDGQIAYKEPVPLFVYTTTSYVSAISAHPTFIEDQAQQDILQTDYPTRVAQAHTFFKGADKIWSKQFLETNHIKYIYQLKVFDFSITKKLPIEKAYENDDLIIYKVKL